jgi:hypothetical protein
MHLLILKLKHTKNLEKRGAVTNNGLITRAKSLKDIKINITPKANPNSRP